MKVKLGAILLAAGKSSRMETNKIILPWEGLTIGEKIITSVSKAGIKEIVFVVGHDYNVIMDVLGPVIKKLKIKVVYNQHYERGMLSSIQEGVKKLDDNLSGFFIILGDQPFIDQSWLITLRNSFNPIGKSIVIPVFEEKRGHPILLSIGFKDEILSLNYQVDSLRTLLERHSDKIININFSDKNILYDIDNKEEYIKYSKLMQEGDKG